MTKKYLYVVFALALNLLGIGIGFYSMLIEPVIVKLAVGLLGLVVVLVGLVMVYAALLGFFGGA